MQPFNVDGQQRQSEMAKICKKNLAKMIAVKHGYTWRAFQQVRRPRSKESLQSKSTNLLLSETYFCVMGLKLKIGAGRLPVYSPKIPNRS